MVLIRHKISKILSCMFVCMCALFTTTLSTYAYTVTYYGGNCNPNQQTNYFDTTYSVTDSNHPATGDNYPILMYTDTPPLDTIFTDLNNMTFPNDFYTEGTGCYAFLGWLDENNHNYNFSIYTSDPPPAINPYGSEDVNLYAKCYWYPIEVGYYPGTCNGSAHREYVGTYGTSFNMPSASAQGITPPNNEYTFRGWSLDPSATTVDYNVGDSYTLDVCVYTNEKYEYPYYRFYAVCKPNEYSINYYHIENSDTWAGNNPTTYTYGTTTNIGTPSRTNYVFLGWCVGSDGCNNYADYQNGYTISGTTTGDVNLYAQWDCAAGYNWNSGHTACVATEYTITYVINAPDDAIISDAPDPNPATSTAGNQYHLAITPSAGVYSCQDWVCVDGNNQPVNITVTIFYNYINMPNSNVTCTTQCARTSTIHLKWDSNGGTPNTITNPDSCVYGSLAGETGGINYITQPTRPGYIFKGWLLTKYQCDLSYLDLSINGSSFGDDGIKWISNFNYGTFEGTAKCSSVYGSTNWYSWDNSSDNWLRTDEEIPEDSSAAYCWCKLTKFTPNAGEQCHISTKNLVYFGSFSPASQCEVSCRSYCALYFKNKTNFRKAFLDNL